MTAAIRTYSQEFIGTTIRFSKEAENGRLYSASRTGIIKLNDQNNEFSFNTSLFPILTSPSGNDSIMSLNKNMNLDLFAEFPVDDLDFYESNASESSFEIPAEITINGITRQVNIQMGVHKSIAHDVESRDAHSYPVRISFIIDVNPGDYNLDFETINFIRSISIEVRNGIINKSTGTNR